MQYTPETAPLVTLKLRVPKAKPIYASGLVIETTPTTVTIDVDTRNDWHGTSTTRRVVLNRSRILSAMPAEAIR